MNKQAVSVLFSLFILELSYLLYKQALTNASYLGLPTVACQDYTKPVIQNYSLTISITVYGKVYPLDSTIGHDYGKCLHVIYVNDKSGRVYVKANDNNTYTLGQFFDVWRKTFNNTQMGQYMLNGRNGIEVLVNGKKVSTLRTTPLLPNENIQIIYQ